MRELRPSRARSGHRLRAAGTCASPSASRAAGRTPRRARAPRRRRQRSPPPRAGRRRPSRRPRGSGPRTRPARSGRSRREAAAPAPARPPARRARERPTSARRTATRSVLRRAPHALRVRAAIDLAPDARRRGACTSASSKARRGRAAPGSRAGPRPPASRCVANVWRSACGEMSAGRPAARSRRFRSRAIERVVSRPPRRLTKSGSPSSSRALARPAQRRPHRQPGAQRVLRLLAERDDALLGSLARGRGRGARRDRGPRRRGPRPPRRAAPSRTGARRGRARARARSSASEASSRLSVSATVIARGSDRGTRGETRPAAGFFSRWPSRQAQRKSERSVERCRAIDRFFSPARWRAARYERTASVSIYARELRGGGLLLAELVAPRSRRSASRSVRYASTVRGEKRRSSARYDAKPSIARASVTTAKQCKPARPDRRRGGAG